MAEIIKINQNTWRFEEGFVRFFLLEGEEKAVMIDSGVACPDAAELAKTVTDKPVMLLNTHGDGDHVSGTGGFKEIHIHTADYYGCEIDRRFPDTALAEVDDGDIIELGNRPLKIIHIPGHTRGSIAILDVNDRVLYSGDSVQEGHIFMFGAKRDPEVFEAALDKLIAMKDDYDLVYASHGGYSLANDYPEKVKAAWQRVRNGEVEPEETELHGVMVKSFTTPDCGFYLDK